MSLKAKIIEDLKAAMKAGDTVKRDTLRFLDSAIKNAEIEKKKREAGLSDEEVLEVVMRSVKQRKDSIAQFNEGGRPELAEKEEVELRILEIYLPEQMGEDAIREIVVATLAEAGSNEIGKVMGPIMAKLKGKADGNVVRRIVEEEIKK